ncbi:AAA family ATPase [Salipiger mucosus]|uniref:ATP-dependent Clp protease ATP-binding protein subunit ClpA n=1 Tax=Salipiger mucosus DSM 16094 TaxID=1123237 RepID=S9QWU1_9RHOB|nr:AAA family ATPase [Salipiger mucosus]EPX84047.1 ATP-dependent Clp protease ATP-binding protein subunit ClpA [Salipiger mucosus DSM 16094]
MSENTRELSNILSDAERIARDNSHSSTTAEHLLLSIMEDDSVKDAIAACDAPVDRIRELVQSFVVSGMDKLKSDPAQTPEADDSVNKIMRRARILAQTDSGSAQLNNLRVLTALIAENGQWSSALLAQHGVTRFDVVNWAKHGVTKSEAISAKADGGPGREASTVGHRNGSRKKAGRALEDFLLSYTRNLTELALEGQIAPVIGRASEIERTVRILSRKEKSNPVFVGDPGVGKTKLAEGLALQIAEGRAPDVLKNRQLIEVDMAALMSGCKFRGDFEERVKKLIGIAESDPTIILFIDEIHSILEIGDSGGDTMGAGDIMKPALSRGNISVIGATTFKEYRSVFEKDPALSRRFQKVMVEEPDRDTAIEIVEKAADGLSDHHGVSFSEDIIEHAVDLSIRYIRDRKLPDKALDLLDETAAGYSSAEGKRVSPDVVSREALEKSAELMTGVPVVTGGATEIDILRDLDATLASRIFGQRDAVSTVSRAIKVARAGLRESERPIGSFLFVGPTGVGKTELTRSLSEAMGLELIRFDMSEYMEKHSVARLIGAPPGYVGHTTGGQLTEAVQKNPYSVVLLDEIEKAHPDIADTLLQVMDHGTLTDAQGRKIDFRNTIIILTSNAGASAMAKPGIGFGSSTPSAPEDNPEIENVFRPEFRNRLDAIVSFHQLPREAVSQIVDAMIADLEERLADKQVTLDITPEARDWLAKKGHSSTMGARPMGRLIYQQISTPLSEEVLFGALAGGGMASVSVDTDSDELKIAAVAD